METIVGPMEKQDWAYLDLDFKNRALTDFNVKTYEGLEAYVNFNIETNNKKLAMGGYLERRTIYAESSHFTNAESQRNIHLGVDIWGPVGLPVFAPLDGEIHSFAFNNQYLDYGATIITKHAYRSSELFLLFGHLSLEDIKKLRIGTPIVAGELLGHLGNRDENGGWPPHLHFQAIKSLGNWQGDYPGVCSENELLKYSKNILDPTNFMEIKKPSL